MNEQIQKNKVEKKLEKIIDKLDSLIFGLEFNGHFKRYQLEKIKRLMEQLE